MRYSREHKQETHDRIVKKASVRLREKGAHGIGVADLMKEAGLTHGGFYAHFNSREALVIEAFDYAMDRSMEHWRKQSDQVAPEKQLPQIVETYLSTVHRDNPGHGCSIPALGAEIARESPKTRKAFAGKLDEMIEMMTDFIPKSAAQGRAQAGDRDAGDHGRHHAARAHRRLERAVGRGVEDGQGQRARWREA